MTIASLLLLQAAATSTTPAPLPSLPPERIDLLSLGATRCPADADPADIVVCARRHSDRLGPPPVKPGPPDLPPMTVRLPGGGTANLHAADSTLPGGHGSAAVVTLKVPF